MKNIIVTVIDSQGCVTYNGEYSPLNHRIIFEGPYVYGAENLIRFLDNAQWFLNRVKTEQEGQFGTFTWRHEE